VIKQLNFKRQSSIKPNAGKGFDDSATKCFRYFATGSIILHATANKRKIAENCDRKACLPQLLTFNSPTSLVDVIKRELVDAEALHIASAFYSRGMLNLLLNPFMEFIQRGGRLRLLTSVMGNFNNPRDLAHLSSQIPEIEIKIFYPLNEQGKADFNQQPPPFHIKSFLFEKPTGQHSIIVGSSNLTGSGLSRNHEWNYFSNSETNLLLRHNLSAFQYALQEYESYWNESSVPIDCRFISAYQPRWDKAHELRAAVSKEMNTAFQNTLEPRPAQITALQSLAKRRNQGVTKTTVIAATGLGKTYLAAFDYKQSGMRNILFIAHRENILINAMDTFRSVTGDSTFGAILSGSSKPTQQNTNIFAMIQTISQPSSLNEYSADAFDYIVIDEFHHAEAASYQSVVKKFNPKFLLGLTATPERMDGRDVLKICDYDVAFETRLFDAIENRWLVPFQYFAIHDSTDYSSLRWTNRGYIDSELDKVLMHDTRAELIFKNLRKFLPSTGKVKALAFCSSKNHAEYMNRRFNELGKPHGIRSLCLLGQHSTEDRKHAMQQLQDEKENLQIICSVDIFGEGIDIPAVSHVLFLRPTQSFTVFIQQLGRGLRQLPEKDYLVALDFVGNFRQSYVAPIALRGYTSTEGYKKARRNKEPQKQIPAACCVDVDTGVQRIWEAEIKKVLAPANRIDALKGLYIEIRSNLGRSPSIMDFFANPTFHDPYVFLKEEKFGGNWLRVKLFMDDLTLFESTLIGTPAEKLLQHFEKELSPVKSYKMVVLKSLLAMGGTEWPVDAIAGPFLEYYLENKERLTDWDELAKSSDPEHFPEEHIISHLMRMPLNKMINTGSDFFELDRTQKIFKLRKEFHSWWMNNEFQELILDRVDFGLARYFYRKDKASLVSENLRGFAIEIPYATQHDSGYSETIRKVIASAVGSNSWDVDFGKKGYSGSMELEILKEQNFLAWTHIRYSDVSRFPARIKAAATALYREGQYGEFNVKAHGTKLLIIRKL
jgi:superfamily II DNA or RNA helicase/HKD family nuclease